MAAGGAAAPAFVLSFPSPAGRGGVPSRAHGRPAPRSLRVRRAHLPMKPPLRRAGARWWRPGPHPIRAPAGRGAVGGAEGGRVLIGQPRHVTLSQLGRARQRVPD